MEPFPRDTISALGKPTAKIQKISNGQDCWRNSKQDGAFSPGSGLRLEGIDGEDIKISNRSGLLEEFEARWSLFPGIRFPPWGNRRRRYKRSPTVRTVGGIRSKMEPFPLGAISPGQKAVKSLQPDCQRNRQSFKNSDSQTILIEPLRKEI